MRLWTHVNQTTNDLAEIFLEKCMQTSDCVALVLNKSSLSSEEYKETYDLLRKTNKDYLKNKKLAKNGGAIDA